jgi:hypothetical protein
LAKALSKKSCWVGLQLFRIALNIFIIDRFEPSAMNSLSPLRPAGLPKFLTFYWGPHRWRAQYEIGDDCLHAILRRIRTKKKCDFISAYLETDVDPAALKHATCYRVYLEWIREEREAVCDWLWIPKTVNHATVDDWANPNQLAVFEFVFDDVDPKMALDAA